MSPYLKSAGIIAIVVVLLSVLPIFHIAVTGGGGLGAVSFGISEELVLAFVVLTVAAWAFIYWRSRRRQRIARD